MSQAEFLLLMFGYNINLFIHRSGPGLAPTIRAYSSALIVAEKKCPSYFPRVLNFILEKNMVFFYFQQKQMF